MEKRNRSLWVSFSLFIIITFIQNMYALTGHPIPALLIWFYNIALIIFLVFVFIRFSKK